MSNTRKYLKLLCSVYHEGLNGDTPILCNPTIKDINKLKRKIQKFKKSRKIK